MGVQYNTYNPRVENDNALETFLHLDAGNPKSYSPNTFKDSLDLFGTWTTGGANATFSRETGFSSPARGRPLKMVCTGNDPYTNSYNNSSKNITLASSGQTWTVSVWVKASQTCDVHIFIFGVDSSGSYSSSPDFSSSSHTATTNWQRIQFTRTFSNSNTVALQVRLDGPDTFATYPNTTVWWDGLQVERASSASPFCKIYNENGENWRDLSGGGNDGDDGNTYWAEDFKLYNAPSWSNGVLSFNGTNQYARSASTMSVGNARTGPYETWGHITVESIIKYNNTTQSAAAYEHSSNWNTNSGAFGLFMHNNGSGNYANIHHTNHNTGIGARNYAATVGTDWSVHTNVFGCVIGSSRLVYVNGELLPFTTTGGYGTGTSVTANAALLDTYFYIASRGGTTAFAGMQIASLKIYKGLPTASQVKKSFESVRGRFGI